MPWCPNCRTEYRPGFDTCHDCGAMLIEALPVDPSVPMEREHTGWLRPVLTTAGVAFGYLVVWFLCPFSESTASPKPGEFAILITLMSILGFSAGMDGRRKALTGLAIGWFTWIGLLAFPWFSSGGAYSLVADLLFISLFSLAFSAPAAVSAYLGSRYSRKNVEYLLIWIALTVILAALPDLAAYSAR